MVVAQAVEVAEKVEGVDEGDAHKHYLGAASACPACSAGWSAVHATPPLVVTGDYCAWCLLNDYKHLSCAPHS